MNRTIEQAKQCICNPHYSENVRIVSTRSISLTEEEVNEALNCHPDTCMAWEDNGYICEECGQHVIILQTIGEDIELPADCPNKCKGKLVQAGYCKIIENGGMKFRKSGD